MKLSRSVLAAAVLAAAPVLASAQTQVVSPLDAKGWSFAVDSGAGSCAGTGGAGTHCELVNGPAAAQPAGKGSARIGTELSNQGHVLGTFAYAGVPISALFGDPAAPASYWTYQVSSGPQALALQVDIDHDPNDANTGFQGRMVYEPYQQPGATVNSGEWQQWSPSDPNARFWFTPGSGYRPLASICPQSNPCTLSTILAQFPSLSVRPTVGRLLFKAGSGWTGFEGYVDAARLGSTLWDFELGPTNKEECKDGGWQGLFRNQGQCVSFFASAKR